MLPITAKLSKTLQSKQLDLSMISALVDASITSIDDAITPAAIWILELLDNKDDIQQTTGETICYQQATEIPRDSGYSIRKHSIKTFSRRFEAQDIVSALSIFDPRKVPSSDSTQLPTYGTKSIELLTDHYAQKRHSLTLDEEEMQKEGLITPELHTEWITFRAFLSKKAEDDIAKQLKELVTNEMLITMFPNLTKIASIYLTIPVSTASVERSFSEMKLIKTRLRNSLSEGTLSQLMRIGIEAPETDDDLDAILEVWNRKPRRIPI